RLAVYVADEGTYRHLTPALERREKRTLRASGDRCRLVIERDEQLAHLGIIDPGLDGNRALSGSGKPIGRVEEHGNAPLAFQPNQSGRGEHRGVDAAAFDLAQSGRDVAPKLDHLEIRPTRKELSAAAKAGSADA